MRGKPRMWPVIETLLELRGDAMKLKIPKHLDSIENPLLRFLVGKYEKSTDMEHLAELEEAMHSLGYVLWCPELDEKDPKGLTPVYQFRKRLPEVRTWTRFVLVKLLGVRELSDLDCSNLRRIS